MVVGDRVKFSEYGLDKLIGQENYHLKYSDRRGTIVGFSGKNDVGIRVKWDGLKTVQKYYCNYVIRV